MVTVLGIILVAALVVLIVRGLWRATSRQQGTGCPCCDKAMGHTHEHEHAESKDDGHGKAASAKS
jgi:hypothetical protein